MSDNNNLKSTVLWVSGQNLSGYMPMNSPYLTTDWESAKDSLVEDIERYRESMWDSLSMSLDKICPLDESEEWGATEVLDWWFGGNDQWIPWSELNAQDRTERNDYADDGNWRGHLVLTEHDYDVLKEISEHEDVIKELGKAVDGAEFFCGAGNYSYWIQESDRNANSIPESLEGEELEELIDKLNEEGY